MTFGFRDDHGTVRGPSCLTAPPALERKGHAELPNAERGGGRGVDEGPLQDGVRVVAVTGRERGIIRPAGGGQPAGPHRIPRRTRRRAGEETSRQTTRRTGPWEDPARRNRLLDSHISGDLVAKLDGSELIQSPQHHDGSWFPLVSGPAAETGTDPCCK